MALPHLAFDHFHRRVVSCHLILLDGHPFLGLYSILFCPPYFVFIFLEYPARSALRPQRIHVLDLYKPRLPGHDWLWDWELLLLVADCHGNIPHVIVAGMFDSGLDDRQIGGWELVVGDAVHDKLNSYIITTRFTPARLSNKQWETLRKKGHTSLLVGFNGFVHPHPLFCIKKLQ